MAIIHYGKLQWYVLYLDFIISDNFIFWATVCPSSEISKQGQHIHRNLFQSRLTKLVVILLSMNASKLHGDSQRLKYAVIYATNTSERSVIACLKSKKLVHCGHVLAPASTEHPDPEKLFRQTLLAKIFDDPTILEALEPLETINDFIDSFDEINHSWTIAPSYPTSQVLSLLTSAIWNIQPLKLSS